MRNRVTNRYVTVPWGTWLFIGRCGKSFAVKIDAEDLPLLRKYKWTLDPNGYVKTGGRPNVTLSRLIMNAPKGTDVDHIHHDILDNRKSELRVVTRSINSHNRKRLPRNVYYLPRRGTYLVKFLQHRKQQRFGTYRTLVEAQRVAAQVRAKLLAGEEVTGNGGRAYKRASGVRYVSYDGANGSKPWKAAPSVNCRPVYLGRYATIEEAAARVKQWEQERDDLKNAAHAA